LAIQAGARPTPAHVTPVAGSRYIQISKCDAEICGTRAGGVFPATKGVATVTFFERRMPLRFNVERIAVRRQLLHGDAALAEVLRRRRETHVWLACLKAVGCDCPLMAEGSQSEPTAMPVPV
jgi:hypothetical protein